MYALLLLNFLWAISCQSPLTLDPSKATPALTHPVLYARYENLPPLYRERQGACSQAKGYQGNGRMFHSPVDLCGPDLRKQDTLKAPWTLPSGVKSILWEQDLKTASTPQIEVIGHQGLPLPSTSQMSQLGSRALLELKPKLLLKNTLYTLVVSEISATGTRTQTWRIPFRIQDG
ncbi:MAG: hypothetical protein I8H75_06060 [Myxococcaceae bacterium]|nr:hypothetical protein [Myxococcaceae bacterium]MBH2006880.1 hypothetical protein [Myxococcaceae bacterium]